MSDIVTINPDELAKRTTASDDLFALVFAPGGPIQALAFDKMLAKLIAADLVKMSEAVLQSDLEHAEDTVALVINDADPLKNGWWRKLGTIGTGTWSLFEQLALAVRQAALDAAELAGLFANASTDEDIPGAEPGMRGAQFWFNKAKDEADRAQEIADNVDLGGLIEQAPTLPERLEMDGTEWFVVEVGGVAHKLSPFAMAGFLGIDVPLPAPLFDVDPSITGTVQVGQTLTGDDGDVRFGTVSSRAWLRDGTPIAGASGATYELVFADQDASIALRVTANGDGGTTQATSIAVGPVLGLALVQAPSFDTFDTGSGNIIGRTLQGRGGTWTLERATDGSATHDTSMSVAGGFAGGNGVAGAGNHYAVATAPSQTVIVARRLPNQFGANLFSDHVTASGGTAANITRFGFTSTEVPGPPLSGRININPEVAGGSATSAFQISGLRREAYDVQAHEYVEGAGSSLTLQMRMNGRAHAAPFDASLATRNVPLSRKHGFSGNASATHLDWFQIVEPANDAVAMLEEVPTTISRLADGRALVIVRGRYTVQGLGKVKAQLNDRSSGSPVPVAGYTSIDVPVTVSEMVGLYGTYVGMFFVDEATAAGLVGKPLETWVWRDDVANPAGGGKLTVPWPSPIQRLGVNVGYFGQSNSVFQGNQTQTTAAAPATGSRWVDGRLDDTILNAYDRRMLPISANTIPAHLSKRWGDLSGTPLTLITGGRSGTPTSQRLPGTAQFNALRDGISHAGGRVDFFFDKSGESNIDNAPNYYGDMTAIYSGPGSLADINIGGPPYVIVMPLATSHNSSDASFQAVCEVQVRLVEDGIAQALGPTTNDVRKLWNGTEILHFGNATTDPYGSMAKIAQRQAQQLAFIRGHATHNGFGPELFAAVKTGARQVKSYFSDGGSWFDSMELVGAGFHGGTRFSANADGSSPVWPSSCSISGSRVASGTYAGMFEITHNFSADLPADLKMWAGFGANPHNPLQDPTVNESTWDDPVTGASILRGVKAGMPAGLDYVGIVRRLRYSTPSYVVVL